MTRNPTTTFRLDPPTLELLDVMQTAHGISRAQVVRQAVAAIVALSQSAQRDALAKLHALRERYGDDARLMVTVSEGADGQPLAHLVIDGAGPEDARAFPVVIEGTDHCVVFLDVIGDYEGEQPVLARIGDEALLVPPAQFPLGELPWPPRKDLGIVLRLGDVNEVPADTPEPLQPVTREMKRLYARLLMTSPRLKINALTSDDWQTIGMSEEEGRALLSRPDFPWAEVIRELDRDEFDAKLAEELGMSLELVKEMRKRLYDVAPGSHKPENLERAKA
jgi:hypothetical protein